MTVVCVLGFGSPPASLAVTAPVLVPPAPGAAALIDTLRPPLDAGEVVIALYPGWQPDPWLRNLQIVRSVLGSDALVGVPVDLPPLAGAVFGGVVAQVASARTPAQALTAIDLLVPHVTAIGWLGTVSGLAHLPVSLQLHTRSVVPGSAFLAVATGPDRGVVPASRRKPSLPLPLADHTKRVTLAPGEKGDLEPVRAALTASGWWAGTTEVATHPLGATWWGSDRYVELVVHPAEAAAPAVAIGPLPDGRVCARCERRTPSDPCSFCHHRTTGAAA